jgi:hypothetical protein
VRAIKLALIAEREQTRQMSRSRLSKKTASYCHVPSIWMRLAALFFHPVQDKQHLFLDKTPKTAPKQPLFHKNYKNVWAHS